MIKTFKHRGVQRFFETGSKAGVQAAHAPKLARQLRRLDISTGPHDMDVPGWNLHPLKDASGVVLDAEVPYELLARRFYSGATGIFSGRVFWVGAAVGER